MVNEIKISVITPLYNSAKYICEFTDKFLQQTLNNIELIYVDDASPDNGLEIARQYELKYSDKIKVLHYDINRRAGGARNYGLLHARGKYVAFIDPDDWMDNTMLEKLYDVAELQKCDVVDCDYYEFDSYTGKTKECISYRDNSIGITNNEVLNNSIAYGGRIFTKIFDRQMLVDNKLFYPENVRFEDNGIFHQIKSKKIGKVKEFLFYYRTNSQTSQTSGLRNNDYIYDRIVSANNLIKLAFDTNTFNVIKEGLEFRYIELSYSSNIFIYVCFNYRINLNNLKLAKDNVLKYFPDYNKNKYFKLLLPKKYKILTQIYEINPYLLYVIKFCFPILKIMYKIYKSIKDRLFKGI